MNPFPPSLTAAQRQQVLIEFNDTAQPYPSGYCLHELVEQQVLRTPQASAVIFEDVALSYAELNAQANRLAHLLRERGVGADRLVAVCLPRSAQLIVALLAIVKAGGAYLPLDPATPRQRLAALLADAVPVLVLTERSMLALFAQPLHEAAVCLDRDAAVIAAHSDQNLPNLTGPRNLVYVIYTSGSTGMPKGVLIEHSGLINNLSWQIREFGFDAADRFAQRTPIVFDASCWEVWTPLLIGAVQVLASDEDMKDAPRILRLMARQRVTVAQAVPSFLSVLIAELEREPLVLALRMMIAGGEALSTQDAARWMRLSGAELVNTYGPTECTIDASFHRCTAASLTAPIPIGRPLANTRIYLLDAAMQPVAPGQTGELYIGGAGIARGYLNRPQLTAERFVADPFTPGERLYRSGDLGSHRNNGDIVFHGRDDHQVKIRGYRIELGEIEQALLACVAVREAAVTTCERSAGDVGLVAYYVPREPADGVDAAALRAHLAERLPGYMVPAALVRLPDMPHTATGKVDRNALPAPGADAYDLAQYQAPAGTLETTLAAIWAQVLGVQRIGRSDNFFDLGGHSLLAMQIANRLRAATGADVTPYQILARPTIAELAPWLATLPQHDPAPAATADGTEGAAAFAHADAAAMAGDANRYLATPSQVQVAFFALLTPGNRAYLTQSMMIFRGALDVPRLHATLQQVVDRHEHLRTTYALEHDGSLVGTIHPALPVELPQCDLRQMPPALRAPMFTQMCDAVLNAGIEPHLLPLVKWYLFRFADDEFRLLMVEHHYVHDGWSVRKVMAEMAELYTAAAAGGTVALPEPTQFRAYAQWQRRWLASDAAHRQLQHWTEYLRGSDTLLALPFSRPRPANPRLVGEQVALHLPAALIAQLQAQATGMRVTLFQLLFSGYALLLRRYSGRRDFLLGTSSANRHQAAWESVLGMLVNMVPVRIAFEEQSRAEQGSAAQWLAACAASLHHALSMAQTPFSTVVDALKPARVPGVMPLLQFQFSAHNALTKELRFGDLDWELCESLSNGTTKFDLGVIAIPQPAGQGVELLFEYDVDLFDRAAVQRIAQDYETLLRALVQAVPPTLDVLLTYEPAQATPRSVAAALGVPSGSGASRVSAAARVAAETYLDRDTVQGQVAAIWAQVLKRPSIGPDENFFDLGGHSILAMQVIARLRRVLDADVSMSAIFAAPTVRSLAARLTGTQAAQTDEAKGTTTATAAAATPAMTSGATGDEPAPAAARGEAARRADQADAHAGAGTGAHLGEDAIPLSAAQRELWFIERLEGAGSTYNVPYAVRLKGPLQQHVLARALNALLVRHASLRTRFRSENGIPVQQVVAAAAIELPLRRLPGQSRAQRQAQLDEALREAFARPFDLTQAPLLRAWLWQLDRHEHVLLLSLHHIITDGWSMGVLVEDLGALYTAFTARAPSPLAPLPMQFADHARQQRQWLEGPQLQQQLQYWRASLAGLEPLPLPHDRPRPVRPTYRGGEVLFDIEPASAERVKALGRSHGVTLFTVMLSVFQVLLMRWTGQQDLAVGTPVAGRDRIELEGLIGCFVNMVVLRADLSADPRFDAFLKQNQTRALDAFDHQQVPFDQLVADLRPQRELSVNPLFQVSFALNGPVTRGLSLPDLRCEPLGVSSHTSKFDLSLSLSEIAGGLHGRIEYSTELFERRTIERLVVHYRQLLDSVLNDPGCAVSRLALVTPAERARLLAHSRGAGSGAPTGRGLHALFEEQAQRSGPTGALVCEGRALSYAELNSRANRLAHLLRARGVGPERLVGLCLPRGPELIVALLAIVKAGGAYLPLDSSYPAQRLAFMLADAKPVLVITDQTLMATFAELPADALVCVDRDGALIEAQASDNPPVTSGARSLAYVIYTSGSTGQPKGVMIEQHSVVNLVVDSDYVHLAADDGVAQASNHAFDAATFEIWGALLNGARLVLLTRDDVLSATDLAARIREHKITTMFLTTALFNELSAQQPALFAGMKQLLFGGEAGDPRAALRVLEAGAPQRLVNGYGPTETTTFASAYTVPASVAPTGGALPIGRPLANVQVYILDRHLEPVPAGVTGEIHIGGAGVGRGYLNRPELNAQRFIADPFGAPGALLYRSGDLGRWLPDGQIGYAGRADQQIKLRGFRIEPGEIEAALRCCAGVRDALVMLRADASGNGRLIAWYVPDPAAPADPDGAQTPGATAARLRGALREVLPDYMIPSAFVALDALALTANGKIDRAMLPAPPASAPALPAAAGKARRNGVAASSVDATAVVDASAHAGIGADGDGDGDADAGRDPLHTQLVQLWQQVLQVRPIGLDDDFFQLGGHSLLAVQLLAAIEQEFGQMLRLASLFECPTIRQLARMLRVPTAPARDTCVVAVQPKGGRAPIFFVSGWGGAVLVFNRLARELGTDQPLYVLDNSVFGHEPGGAVSVERVATQMIAQMRAVQPSGPYQLAGFSLGGKFVYEMAQQLLRAGEAVSLLALLDCYAPGYPKRRGFAVRTLLHLRHAFGLGPRAMIGYLAQRIARLKKYAVPLGPQLFTADAAVGATAVARAMQQSADVMLRAWEAYEPRRYPGRLVLIRARVQELAIGVDAGDPQLGWSGLIGGGIEVHPMNCQHRNMLDPQHAAELARILTAVVPREPRRASARRTQITAGAAPRAVHPLDR